jgi:hypothetical protein
MALIAIRIDKNTLPKDGQKVKWQTYQDFNNEVWKEGHYIVNDESDGDDGLFSVGFENTTDNWDLSESVLHWEAIK